MEHKARLMEKVGHSVKETVTKVVKVILVVFLAMGIIFLMGFVAKYLRNWLIPDLFGLPGIGYWKALGILILAKIIFGFGGGGHKRSGGKSSSKKKCSSLKRDLTKWQRYKAFWEEEGETAYQAYKERNDLE